jgi:DNA repair exonuclease SbcCD ATPase subunit
VTKNSLELRKESLSKTDESLATTSLNITTNEETLSKTQVIEKKLIDALSDLKAKVSDLEEKQTLYNEYVLSTSQIKILEKSLLDIAEEGVTNNKKLETEKERIQGEITINEVELVKYTSKCSEIENSIKSIKEKKSSHLTEIEEKQKLLNDLLEKKGNYQNAKDTIEKNRDNFEKSLGLYEGAKIKLRILTIASDSLNPKSGIPVYMIDIKLPELKDLVNHYMEVLGMPNLSVSFETLIDEEETFSILVDNGVEPKLDVAAYSGGQLNRIERAISFSLADMAESMRDVRLGFALYDEPAAYLDDNGKEAFTELVHTNCSQNKTPVVLIINHDKKMMSGFNRRIFIEQHSEGHAVILS